MALAIAFPSLTPNEPADQNGESLMAQDQELRLCPFCGGAMQPRHALWPSDGDTDAVIHAEPTECGLAGGFSIGTADNGVSVSAAWNRRAAVPEALPVPDGVIPSEGKS
jgi:hypothetical protein